jgi:hypothetical protein
VQVATRVRNVTLLFGNCCTGSNKRQTIVTCSLIIQQCKGARDVVPRYLHPTVLPECRLLPDGVLRKWWAPVVVVAASSPGTACARDCWSSACTASPVPGQNVSPLRQAASSLHTRDNRTGPTETSSSLENTNA